VITARHKESLEILTMLATRWPKAFAVHEAKRRPLKIGIHRDVEAALGAHTPPRLRQALAAYCNAPGYLRQCLPGAWRCGLDGECDGEVTADEAANARYKLEQRTAKRVEPAEPVAAKSTVQPPIKSTPMAARQPASTAATPTAPAFDRSSPTGEQLGSTKIGLAGLREAARRRASRTNG
jgi:sRNA-binding protein